MQDPADDSPGSPERRSTPPRDDRVPTFATVKDGDRFHVVRMDVIRMQPTEVAMVATLQNDACDPHGLADAMNDAVWEIGAERLEQVLRGLPTSTRSSVERAVAEVRMSHPVIGDDGYPLVELKDFYTDESDVDMLLDDARAAHRIDLFSILTNEVGPRSRTHFRLQVFSDGLTAPATEPWARVPAPNGWTVTERRLVEDPDAMLEDPRWTSHCCRLFPLVVRESDAGDAVAIETWIVEYGDRPLSDTIDELHFIHPSPADADQSVLTPRNRFTTWMALTVILADLEGLINDGDPEDSTVWHAMPTPVQQQPQPWWRALTRSTHRLAEATRRGAYEEMRPRTVGEEALLYLASRQWMIDAAHNQTDLLDLTSIHDSLPAHRDDGELVTILPALTGDTDVAIVWADDYLTAADPTGPENQQLGVGNYLPEAWHRLFERDIRNLPTPTPDAD